MIRTVRSIVMLTAAVLAGTVATMGTARAQSYPNKPLHIITSGEGAVALVPRLIVAGFLRKY